MSLTLGRAVSVRELRGTTGGVEITDRDSAVVRKIDAELDSHLAWITGCIESDDGERVGRHETICMSHAAAEELANFLLRAVAIYRARRAA
jgi:hypothetical protein